MFCLKFTFDRRQYKPWSINYEAVNLYTMELEKGQKTLLNQSKISVKNVQKTFEFSSRPLNVRVESANGL